MIALLVLPLALAAAPEFPEAEISNGPIRARLYLPDAGRGYYRGTRFDWSGVIYSLEFKGHEYFGQWFERYDPHVHDAIMGPVEEYRTGDAGLGYSEAKPGETFIRIGAGVVRKPDEPAYQFFHTYDIVNPGQWTVRPAKDRVEFIHELSDPASGYAYLYRKVVRLERDKPELVIEHVLKNTGRKPIETTQYNHNFFTIDKQPSGPDVSVKFPFLLKSLRDLGERAEVRGNELLYREELAKGQTVFTQLEGFGATPADYDIRIENRKTGAGVRIRGDRPLVKVVFWSIRTAVCPEPWIEMRVEPGREVKWTIRYEFYTLP